MESSNSCWIKSKNCFQTLINYEFNPLTLAVSMKLKFQEGFTGYHYYNVDRFNFCRIVSVNVIAVFWFPGCGVCQKA